MPPAKAWPSATKTGTETKKNRPAGHFLRDGFFMESTMQAADCNPAISYLTQTTHRPGRKTGGNKDGEHKERQSADFVSKSTGMALFAHTHFLSSAPNRKPSYTNIHIRLQFLIIFPRKRQILCAKTRASMRSKHFFCAHRAAVFASSRRDFVLFAEKRRPQEGIPPCFSAFFSLFRMWKAFLAKKQKASGKPRRLTRPASFCVRTAPPRTFVKRKPLPGVRLEKTCRKILTYLRPSARPAANARVLMGWF